MPSERPWGHPKQDGSPTPTALLTSASQALGAFPLLCSVPAAAFSWSPCYPLGCGPHLFPALSPAGVAFLRTFQLVDHPSPAPPRTLFPPSARRVEGPAKDELARAQSWPSSLLAKGGRVSRSGGSLLIKEMATRKTRSQTSRPQRPSSLSLLPFPSPSTPRNSPRHLAAASFPRDRGGGRAGKREGPLRTPLGGWTRAGQARKWTPGGSRRLAPRRCVFLMPVLGERSTERHGGTEVAKGGGW